MLSSGRRIGLEAFSYLMLIAGTLGDHLSTVIALERGLWLPVDIVLIILGIGVPYLLIRLTKDKSFRALFAYPLLHGLIRLGACLWNFSLIF